MLGKERGATGAMDGAEGGMRLRRPCVPTQLGVQRLPDQRGWKIWDGRRFAGFAP